MLGDHNACPTLAVKDLERAKQFYEETLALERVDELAGVGVFYKSGSGKIWVYVSGLAGTNEATALTWEVDDVEEIVGQLKGKGIAFEHYDMEGIVREGDVHIMGSTKSAWFKDPDGNILCIESEQ